MTVAGARVTMNLDEGNVWVEIGDESLLLKHDAWVETQRHVRASDAYLTETDLLLQRRSAEVAMEAGRLMSVRAAAS